MERDYLIVTRNDRTFKVEEDDVIALLDQVDLMVESIQKLNKILLEYIDENLESNKGLLN